MLRVMWIACAIACSGQAAPPRAAVAPAAIAVDAGPPPDAAPLDRDLPRLVQRSLAMYADLDRALAASADDCAAATTRLGELAARNRDVVSANAKVLRDGRAPELRAALAAYGDAFDASAQAIMHAPVVAKCARDRAFARAFDDLLEPPP